MSEERATSVALVTGASSGIGEGFARALAARGERVVLVARRAGRLEQLAAELGGQDRALPLAYDLSQPDACRALAGRLAEQGLDVDLLVNNAGVGSTGRFWEESAERLDQIVELNARALVTLTRQWLPAMVERGRGRILNVVSMSAFQPVPFLATYAASKAFALSLSEALSVELEGTGVKVLALCPGLVRTEFQERAGTDRVPYDSSPTQSIAQVVSAALAGLDGSSPTLIPALRDRLSIFAQRLVPRDFVRRAAARLFIPE